MSTYRWSRRFPPARCLRWITAALEFAAILDEQRAECATIAQDHGIKPVH